MLDYKGLEALATVIEVQGFEAAAKKLYLTQSAISQRIKTLESRYGTPLLIRAQPYQATEMGEQLLGHFKKVLLLENELVTQMEDSAQHAIFSIALSRDSLETWFMSILSEHDLLDQSLINIITNDQEIHARTILETGDVQTTNFMIGNKLPSREIDQYFMIIA